MMGDLSPHFSAAEFACRHCHKLDGPVVHALVTGLEALRGVAYSDLGLEIVSGYRCAAYNRSLKNAAKDSQHLRRAAADVPLRATLEVVKGLGVFSGIGWQLFNGRRLVRHVDVRHASGRNTTGGTVQHPTVWEYALDGSRK